MRQPHSSAEPQPGGDLVLVFEEQSLQIARGAFLLRQGDPAAVRGQNAEQSTVLLFKSIEPGASVVFPDRRAEGGLNALVTRRMVLLHAEQGVARPADEMGAVEM